MCGIFLPALAALHLAAPNFPSPFFTSNPAASSTEEVVRSLALAVAPIGDDYLHPHSNVKNVRITFKNVGKEKLTIDYTDIWQEIIPVVRDEQGSELQLTKAGKDFMYSSTIFCSHGWNNTLASGDSRSIDINLPLNQMYDFEKNHEYTLTVNFYVEGNHYTNYVLGSDISKLIKIPSLPLHFRED